MVQLSGACLLVHQIVQKPEEREKDDKSEKIIVLCPPSICAKVIATKKQFANLTDNDVNDQINMKRVTLDPSNWSSG